MTKNNNVNAQARKAAMVRFINANGGNARMNMKIADVEAMHNDILAKNPNATTDKVVLGQQQPTQEAPKMLTMTEADFISAIDQAIAKATAPLMAKIDELTKPAVNTETVNAEAPAPEAPAPAPAPVPQKDRATVRAEFFQARAEWEAAREAWTAARRTKNPTQILEAKKVYDAKLDALSAISSDMTVREHIAEFFYDAADATRTGGHKAVDAVANVAHKGVDMLANGIEIVGRTIDTKAKPVQQPAVAAPAQA